MQFNLLENKYYLDNLFYRHEFTQYIQRYRKDSQIIRQDDLINDGDEEDTSDSDPIEQMFYSEEDDWEALTYFSHIKTSIVQVNLTIVSQSMSFINYFLNIPNILFQASNSTSPR